MIRLLVVILRFLHVAEGAFVATAFSVAVAGVLELSGWLHEVVNEKVAMIGFVADIGAGLIYAVMKVTKGKGQH